MKQEFIGGKSIPANDRSCTDIICLILFFCGIVAFYVLFGIGVNQGHPSMIFTVWDSSSSPCGIDGLNNSTTKDYKYLYFPSPYGEQFLYKTVCVKECPVSDNPAQWNSENCNLKGNINVTQCTTNKCDATQFLINPNDSSIFCLYQTKVLFDRVCSPINVQNLSNSDLLKNATSAFNKYVKTDFVSEWFSAIQNTWKIILSGLFIAFGVSFLYMLITRYCAGVLVWTSLLLYFTAIIILGILCYQRSIDYQNAGDSSNQQNMQICAIVLWSIAGVSLLILLCSLNKIKLAIAIIKTATQYISDVPFALLVPIIFSLVVACLWVVYIIGFVYLYSNYDTISKSPSSPFSNVTHTKNQQAMLWVFVFLSLWINEFFQAMSIFILVCSCTIWYFNRDNLGTPILTSMKWCLRYHLGSLAFGAFILAFIKLVKYVLNILTEQAKKAGGDQNPLLKCVLQCSKSLIECFESTIKTINKNAYIMVALKGENFCSSAKDACSLLWNNALRAAIINGLGQIYIFIGQVFISLVTTLIVYLILTQVDAYKQLNPFLPCLIVFLIALTIAILFLSVYGMSLDAIFLCFCHDEQLHNGGKHCPPLLKDFLDDNTKK